LSGSGESGNRVDGGCQMKYVISHNAELPIRILTKLYKNVALYKADIANIADIADFQNTRWLLFF